MEFLINDENRQSYVDFMKVCECKCIKAVTVYNNYTLYAFQNKYIEYK